MGPHPHSVLLWLVLTRDVICLDLIPMPICTCSPVCQALTCYLYSQFVKHLFSIDCIHWKREGITDFLCLGK